MITQKDKNLLPARHASLVDAIDRVVAKGAVLEGNISLEVAEVSLIIIGLKLVIASAPDNPADKKTTDEDREYIKKMKREIAKIENQISRLTATNDPEKAEKGIAKLVLTLIVLIKELMEREAIRKAERRSLSRAKMEKLGLTFRALDKKIEEIKIIFGIREDLNIDLGPLGKLL